MSPPDGLEVGGGARPLAPLVKICGVMRVEDARAALAAGADFVGAILTPGFGRSVQPRHAATYLEGHSGDADDGGPVLVAVLVDPDPDQAVVAARLSGAGVVQLHGEETPEVVRTVAAAGPWKVWKAVRVRETDEVARAVRRYGGLVDGLLLDGGRGGERGGGLGIPFDRGAAAALRAGTPPGVRLVLAGGLDPDNVERAVRRFRPDVVDVSSGVEIRRGQKDPRRIATFVRAARNAVGGRGS